jgi:DNA modification methylase
VAALVNPPLPRMRTRTSCPPLADQPTGVFPAPPAPPPARPNHFDLHNFQVEIVPIETLQSSNRTIRRKNEALIERDAECMRCHRLPIMILAFRSGRVLHGEHTLEAYRTIGQTQIPVIFVDDRGEAEVAAARLWLNSRYNAGEIDSAAVRDELKTIFSIDPDWLGATFMTSSQVEFAMIDTASMAAAIDEDAYPAADIPVVAARSDIFVSHGHRLMCGSSREAGDIARLMNGQTADLLGGDPPYGISVSAISRTHTAWQEGSGLNEAEMLAFHSEYLAGVLPHLRRGALTYLFIDAKGMLALLQAVRDAGLDLKTICTWDKEKSGPGGLYLNQTEHIIVARWGKAPAGKGRLRRGKRSTLWSAPGYATFRPDRKQALKDHACTKPGSILMDLLLDSTEPDDLVLDPFGGSGSMTIAAHQLRRRCYSMEIEPRFVDVAVRRFHELTGEYPIHEETGLPFDELARQRGVDIHKTAAAPRRLTTEAAHG